MTLVSAARASLVWIATLVLLSGTAIACSGGPGGSTLKDGAGMSMPAATDAGADQESDAAPASTISAPPGGCWRPEQGCHCLDWGQTIACEGPVYRDGDYVTCAGTRQCVQGFWGPCWPPNYQH